MRYLIPYLHPAENNKEQQQQKQGRQLIKQIESKRDIPESLKGGEIQPISNWLGLRKRHRQFINSNGRRPGFTVISENFLGDLIVGNLFFKLFSILC